MERLRGVVEELVAMTPSDLADRAAVVELHQSLTRLTAVTTEAVAAFDASGAWREDGARSSPDWLAVRTGHAKPEMKRRVWLGRACRSLPGASAAWRAGRISEAKVMLLARARNERTAPDMDRDEAMLVAEAEHLRHDQVQRVVAYWSQRADPDGTERSAAERVDGRKLHVSNGLDGTVLGDFVLDPIHGAIVRRELRSIEDDLFGADWREATERLGAGNVAVADLRRTAAQRRADALVEMARRSATAPADGRRPEPLFTVLVDYPTFLERICQLSDGAVVTPGSLTPWLDEAWVERVVFDGPGRVLDVGVRRRLFDGATRRAVEVRDRECFDEFCDLPAERCQVDHIQPWALDGPTEQANGRLACGPHNRRRHRQQAAGRGP